MLLNIKSIRQQKKLSQVDLAESTGLSAAYIHELEKGKKTNPTIDTLIKISQALGVPITALFKD
ncbi:helix-turn-helix protein [Anaerobacterium chartisolvens]|uniref:Helix-turn-helix protein n=1 Tax=Anaerobacterium chartisolvens TaxID=1297424 RepID=A0A369AMP8_9FIRM|nr:helix-turn-helix protein [Anaerobacterium chartisolvens]